MKGRQQMNEKKTIIRAYVCAQGDPSVGIPSAHIEVDLDLELEGDAQEIAERESDLVEALSQLGLSVWGEKPLVHLDVKGNPGSNLQSFTVRFFTAQEDVASGYRVLRKELSSVQLGWETEEAFDSEGNPLPDSRLSQVALKFEESRQ